MKRQTLIINKKKMIFRKLLKITKQHLLFNTSIIQISIVLKLFYVYFSIITILFDEKILFNKKKFLVNVELTHSK